MKTALTLKGTVSVASNDTNSASDPTEATRTAHRKMRRVFDRGISSMAFSLLS